MKLNKVVEKQHFPVLVIEDVLDAMADAKVYSVIDLTDGFFHVDVADELNTYRRKRFLGITIHQHHF